ALVTVSIGFRTRSTLSSLSARKTRRATTTTPSLTSRRVWPVPTRKSLRPAILQIILGTAFVNRSTISRASVFVEDMRGLSDALRHLAGEVAAIATGVESSVSDTVGDAQDLAEALKR